MTGHNGQNDGEAHAQPQAQARRLPLIRLVPRWEHVHKGKTHNLFEPVG